jgi:EAL domain-containing protein (putative c-di-GMP-specific phosphodiesterase class I)
MREIVGDGRFEPRFRPIFSVERSATDGVELLAKWAAPESDNASGTTSADARRSLGLDHEIADWSLRQACSLLGQWNLRFPSPVSITIPVPYARLADKAFPGEVSFLIGLFNVQPGRLRFEVRSDEYIDAPTTALFHARDVAAMGVHFRMRGLRELEADHRFLRYFSPETVVVDRQETRALRARNWNDGALASLAAKARSMGLQIAADGLRDIQRCAALIALGFSELQGPVVGHELDRRSMDRFLTGSCGQVH